MRWRTLRQLFRKCGKPAVCQWLLERLGQGGEGLPALLNMSWVEEEILSEPRVEITPERSLGPTDKPEFCQFVLQHVLENGMAQDVLAVICVEEVAIPLRSPPYACNIAKQIIETKICPVCETALFLHVCPEEDTEAENPEDPPPGCDVCSR